MKKSFLALVVVAALAAAFFLLRPKPAAEPIDVSPVAAESAVGDEKSKAPVAIQAAPTLASSPGSAAPAAPANPAPAFTAAAAMPAAPAALEFTNLPPTAVLDAMRIVIHSFNSMFGGNPVGNNAEITRALSGDNPHQANFMRPEAGMRVNGSGELIDPWGTPYFFHALSGNDMEIHSAGPDKIMWTADDLVAR